MAVTVKAQSFPDFVSLVAFCAANIITTVISIVTDNSGQYVLFYN